MDGLLFRQIREIFTTQLTVGPEAKGGSIAETASLLLLKYLWLGLVCKSMLVRQFGVVSYRYGYIHSGANWVCYPSNN